MATIMILATGAFLTTDAVEDSLALKSPNWILSLCLLSACIVTPFKKAFIERVVVPRFDTQDYAVVSDGTYAL